MLEISNSAFAKTLDAERILPGVAPKLLLSQVMNTAGFLFEGPPSKEDSSLRFIDLFRSVQNGKEKFSLPEYFELTLAAHFATVATFVPTDMDQTIRLKLWELANREEAEEMANHVFAFLKWNDFAVSTRRVKTSNDSWITGHHGEWFSVAIPAYLVLRKFGSLKAPEILREIFRVANQHEKDFESLLKENNYLNILKAAPLMAHNFGDLDRVIDLWKVVADDPLRSEIYKLGHRNHPDFPSVRLAGELNKAMMAEENHRHYPLRKSWALRTSFDFLLGIGPFFDEWGRTLARHPGLVESDLIEIAEGLIDGWSKLNQERPVFGYARALSGILENHRGGGQSLLRHLPASKRKLATSGSLRAMLSVDQKSFEASWARRAEKWLNSASP